MQLLGKCESTHARFPRGQSGRMPSKHANGGYAANLQAARVTHLRGEAQVKVFPALCHVVR